MNNWLYQTDPLNKTRYILGTKGNNPLLCFGVNPSTATPEQLDPTLKAVERFSKMHGYDSWVMMNLYPQRSTDPNGIHKRLNKPIHEENLQHIENILKSHPKATIWAAWGTLIEKRPFLRGCLQDIIEITNRYNCKWISIGKVSKKGHPHHPLYLGNDAEIKGFDLNKYITII